MHGVLAFSLFGALEDSGVSGTRLASQPQPPQTERERRALAYTKMLEGQRYFSGVRGGNFMTGLRPS